MGSSPLGNLRPREITQAYPALSLSILQSEAPCGERGTSTEQCSWDIYVYTNHQGAYENADFQSLLFDSDSVCICLCNKSPFQCLRSCRRSSQWSFEMLPKGTHKPVAIFSLRPSMLGAGGCKRENGSSFPSASPIRTSHSPQSTFTSQHAFIYNVENS